MGSHSSWPLTLSHRRGAFTALDDSRITRFQWQMVLGIRGRSPAAGLLLGSVSQACAASASGPVVLVKRPGR